MLIVSPRVLRSRLGTKVQILRVILLLVIADIHGPASCCSPTEPLEVAILAVSSAAVLSALALTTFPNVVLHLLQDTCQKLFV